MGSLTLDILQKLVNGDGVAIRVRQTLQPAGGAGEKIFPPTFATGDSTLKYATEVRRIDGQNVDTVLLDSVASQANRMEESLLAAWHAASLNFPVLSVDFSGDPDLADIGQITSLQAPHRIADAILRDATELSGKYLFRDTKEGKAFTDSTPKNATAVYQLCPTALIFGVWDSTGPKGGSGSKFQRALSSEIVAIGAIPGSKVGSRIDPLGIQASVAVYHSAADESDWTIEEAEAKKDKKDVPVLFSRSGGDGKKGKPSSVNHSNVTPSIDITSGGITFDRAIQTVVLSLPALRRLQFQTDLNGSALKDRKTVEQSARVALAALAVAGIVHQRDQGYDLRSRCLLVPDTSLALEAVHADGSTVSFSLTVAEADKLVAAAESLAAKAGLGWEREPIQLKPAPKLAALVKKSRELAMAGAAEEV